MWLFILDLVCSFDLKEDKHSFYRGKNCIKKFCSEPKELGTKVVNYEQIEITPMKFFFMKVKKYVIYSQGQKQLGTVRQKQLGKQKQLGTKVVNYEQIEMTLMKFFFMKVKKYVIYAKERFVMIKNKKRDLSYTKKLEIIVTLQKNLEELLIAFVI